MPCHWCLLLFDCSGRISPLAVPFMCIARDDYVGGWEIKLETLLSIILEREIVEVAACPNRKNYSLNGIVK